ncbi:MAG: primosomal protein N' [Pseudanabaenales cyanobacterium]|nr:primosomal protein N' [Pseudanabaenales cyanobacterium]
MNLSANQLISNTSPSMWVEVLVDCPGAQGLYTYRLPTDLPVNPGDILSIPFGRQVLGGIAIRLLRQLPPDLDPDQIRTVETIISRGFFTQSYWDLLQRAAQYYQTPLIQVVRTALPPGLLAKSQRRIRLKPELIPPDGEAFVSPTARHLLKLLQQSKTRDYTWQYLHKQQRGARQGLQQLLKRGWVESYLASPQPPHPKLRQAVILATTPDTLAEPLTTRQQDILTVLRRQGGDLWLSDALQLCRTTTATLKTLAQKGYLVIQPRQVLRVGEEAVVTPDRLKPLTPHQQKVLAVIEPLNHKAEVLLHGVTGSGKTEIYLQAIAPRLQAGQSALVLAPEIGLTPQLTDRFRRRFGEQVSVYHSALSEGERYDTWRQMLSGQPQVVIGTRSAVFAPLPNLGLIILDEEHDSSFKQDYPSPCYHARTVAQWRADLEDCPLILGSATPSLESWLRGQREQGEQGRQGTQNAEQRTKSKIQNPKSKIQNFHLSLPQRIHARPLSPIQIVDMRQEFQAGNRSIFSRSLRQALEAMKAAGNQGLLFIHRRGHSRFVSCRSCGYVMECPHCDVSLAYHKPYAEALPTLRCHYCGYGRSHPPHCPECGSPYLKHFGSGTQRVIHEIEQQFSDLCCIRFDSDTTRTKGAHRALLTRFAQGEADLLIGTQMLTKGLDLPQVTLVGVIAADGLLYMGDYWASERTFQTLTQVAGRAGRGDQPGQVIIQTYTPEHPVIEAVKRQDYEAFAIQELEQRQALNYPPYGQLILLRLSSPNPTAVKQTAAELTAALEQIALTGAQPTYKILGPAPAPILRVARRYRWHILLKLPLAAKAPDLSPLRQMCPSGVSLTIDVEPLNLA